MTDDAPISASISASVPAFLRRTLHEGLVRAAECPAGETEARLEATHVSGARLRAAAPIDEVEGRSAIAAAYDALKTAMPDMERRDDVFIGGVYEGRRYLGAVGRYCGAFLADLFGIPATGRTLYLRYGEMHRIEGGGQGEGAARIVETTMILDFLDAMRQADVWPLAPSLGVEAPWPGPQTADGVRLEAPDPAASADALALTLGMQDALGAYDDHRREGREGLLAMPQKTFWHPKMMWYGPAGIGTTRGLSGFVDHHQLPFRLALPGRKGGHHYVRIGDGAYSATGGWPSVYATHAGGDWLGLAPSGREVTMRVMDFYRADAGLIRENWVPIDMIDVLRQLGVDVFGRMRALLKRV